MQIFTSSPIQHLAALQQLQIARDLVNHAPGRRPNPQHRCASTRNLRPSCVMYDVRRKPQTQRACLQNL